MYHLLISSSVLNGFIVDTAVNSNKQDTDMSVLRMIAQLSGNKIKVYLPMKAPGSQILFKLYCFL